MKEHTQISNTIIYNLCYSVSFLLVGVVGNLKYYNLAIPGKLRGVFGKLT